jgi:hypothetical protein
MSGEEAAGPDEDLDGEEQEYGVAEEQIPAELVVDQEREEASAADVETTQNAEEAGAYEEGEKAGEDECGAAREKADGEEDSSEKLYPREGNAGHIDEGGVKDAVAVSKACELVGPQQFRVGRVDEDAADEEPTDSAGERVA